MSNIPPPECVTTAGVQAAGNVVGVPVWDDRARAVRAEQMLHAKLRNELFAVAPDVRFRTWVDRGEILGPSPEYRGHGYRLNFSVKPEFSKAVQNIISAQPNEFEQYELWSHLWTDEPPTLE